MGMNIASSMFLAGLFCIGIIIFDIICPDPESVKKNDELLYKYVFFRGGMYLFAFAALACACFSIYFAKKYDDRKAADREAVIAEYKEDGYVICQTNESNDKYAISSDELKKYKEKTANTIFLYKIPTKEEMVVKSAKLELIILDAHDLYDEKDCYPCELVENAVCERKCLILKDEYKRYKSGELFYITVFNNRKDYAELIDTSSIVGIRKLDWN